MNLTVIMGIGLALALMAGVILYQHGHALAIERDKWKDAATLSETQRKAADLALTNREKDLQDNAAQLAMAGGTIDNAKNDCLNAAFPADLVSVFR